MAKKTTKKATEGITDVNEINTENTVSSMDTLTVETVIEEAVKKIPQEINDIVTKFETVKPNDDFVETVMAEPENTEELVAEKIKKLDELETMVQKEMQKVINNSPSIKKNKNFTYMWNGVNLYE
jgi:hypothetical protein